MSNGSFFTELKRRNVYKVAITYAVVAWLLVEIASITLTASQAPGSVLAGVVALLAVGFVLAVIISWSFEATPEGLKRTANVPEGTPLPTWSPRKYATFVIGIAVIAAGLTAYQWFRPKPTSEPLGTSTQADSGTKP